MRVPTQYKIAMDLVDHAIETGIHAGHNAGFEMSGDSWIYMLAMVRFCNVRLLTEEAADTWRHEFGRSHYLTGELS